MLKELSFPNRRKYNDKIQNVLQCTALKSRFLGFRKPYDHEPESPNEFSPNQSISSRNSAPSMHKRTLCTKFAMFSIGKEFQNGGEGRARESGKRAKKG